VAVGIEEGINFCPSSVQMLGNGALRVGLHLEGEGKW